MPWVTGSGRAFAFDWSGTGENLWIGSAPGKIESALNDSVKMREWVDEAVGMMFEDFPRLMERGS